MSRMMGGTTTNESNHKKPPRALLQLHGRIHGGILGPKSRDWHPRSDHLSSGLRHEAGEAGVEMNDCVIVVFCVHLEIHTSHGRCA